MLPVFGTGIVFLAVAIHERLSYNFIFSGDHIESQNGLISRKINTIKMRNLRTINLKQGILQRIVNTGNLQFSSAGGGGVEVEFVGIKNPLKIKSEIEKLAYSFD